MGFLSLIPAKAWEILAVVLALSSFGGYMYYRGGVAPRAEVATVKAQFEAFQGQVKVVGEQAQKAAETRQKADQLAKESTDAQVVKSQAAMDSLYASYRKLRKSAGSGARRSLLSGPAPGSANPERACFQRSGIDTALSDFDSGVTGLLEEGDRAIVNLNAAKAWAAQTLK